MPGDADHHPAVGPEHLVALVEHHLDQARILVLLGRDLPRTLARLDVAQPAKAALGLRHDLVRDGDHIAVRQVVGCRGREQRAEVVTGLELRDGAQRDELERQAVTPDGPRCRSPPSPRWSGSAPAVEGRRACGPLRGVSR